MIADGHVPSGSQADRLRLIARSELLDLGPLSRLLEDSTITEIIVPRYDQVLARKSGQNRNLRSWLCLCAISRANHPTALPTSGEPTRSKVRCTSNADFRGGMFLCAALPPFGIDGPSLVLKRPRTSAATMQTIVRTGAISRAIASFIQQAVSARLRMLVVGPRDSELGIITGALNLGDCRGTAARARRW